MKSNQPIGIFDSGIGGLTVAKAVRSVLPDESIIYFGDTAHLPYGDKSAAAIQAYSVRIAELLLQRACKVVLIACNSASAAAYELVTEYVGRKAKVFDVIHPTVDYIREHHVDEEIGLIGTKQTVAAEVYDRKIKELNAGVKLHAVATPLLVPMIEEGITADRISSQIIERYLNHPKLQDISSLILGCTHYPIIKGAIGDYYLNHQRSVTIIDSAATVAHALKSFLEYHQLINKSANNHSEFLVSDYTHAFEDTTKIFFGEEVHLERVPIWDELN